jgi:hypothetical protein
MAFQVTAYAPAPDAVRKEVGDTVEKLYQLAAAPRLDDVLALTNGDRTFAEYVQAAAAEDELQNELKRLQREDATARGLNPATQPYNPSLTLVERWRTQFPRMRVEVSADGKAARVLTQANRVRLIAEKVDGTWRIKPPEPIPPVRVEYQNAFNQAYRDAMAELRAGTFVHGIDTALSIRLRTVEEQFKDRLNATRAPATSPSR